MTSGFPGHIRDLPLAWRILLTCVVVLIGCGYAAALANVLGQNELVDGRPGLTIDDLRLKYSGAYVEAPAGEAPPSRMLEMIRGSMRQYFSDDAEFEILHGWLVDGATEAGLAEGEDLAPADVLVISCMSCHADDAGHEIAGTASFGPSQFELPEYERLTKFVSTVDPETGTTWVPPRDWRGLALTTHAHLLSVPIFVLLMAALFLWSCPSWAGSGLAGWLAALPLLLFLTDVACWWLARLPDVGEAFLYILMASGGLFAVVFGGQWLVVMVSLWRPRT